MWNANGVSRHKNELAQFLFEKNIDVMLLSETHLTDKHNFHIPGYLFYATNHPDGKAHGGTGILIRGRIKHHLYNRTEMDYLQSTSISMQSSSGPVTLAAVYCPPRFVVSEDQFTEFFNSLGERFIAAGDYNAKHTHWGSRLLTPKGKQLYNALIKPRNKLDHVTPGRPTYWPADPNKLPDLIDFAITRKIPRNNITAESLAELSSDHSPVLLTLWHRPHITERPYRLTGNRTNWARYAKYVCTHMEPTQTVFTDEDVDRLVKSIEETLVAAAKASTPPDTHKMTNHSKTNREIEQLVLEKRRLRREWQNHRSPTAKEHLKIATRKLTRALKLEEANAQHLYIKQLSPTSKRNPLWKAHKSIQPPAETVVPLRGPSGSWIRSDEDRANAFADHLQKVFQPNPASNSFVLPVVTKSLPPINPVTFSQSEIASIIKDLNPKKSPGHDLVAPKMIIELPPCAVLTLCHLFNAITKLGYYPQRWKKAVIVMIPKPGKDKTQPSSYRPISLLTCLSKLFEKAFLKQLTPYLRRRNTIPSHQFGFRKNHGTIEQVNRITNEIRTAFEHREYCSAIFLDVAQAFDRVWLEGLMYKITKLLPQNTHKVFESYLFKRVFSTRCNSSTSHDRVINAGVPQGSVLGPVLYTLFTADMPTNYQLTTSTFADDTAILSRSRCPAKATEQLACHLKIVERWFADWRIKINETKSRHVTFTLNRQTCPPCTLNNTLIPQADVVTYLGVHLDRRLTWRRHIESKRTHMKLKAANLHWLINYNSPLSLEYKVLLYNTVLKPIWTYGCELWGNASKTNIEIIQRAQSTILRTITGAPWYLRSESIHRDLHINLVNEEIQLKKSKHQAKLAAHENPLAKSLTRVYSQSRLKRKDSPAQQRNPRAVSN